MSELSAFPVIKTARLLLREITSADAPELWAIHGNPDLMRWFGSEPLKDLARAQELVNLFAQWRTLPNPGTRWAIQRHGQTTLCGTCGLFSWHRQWRKCVIGYELAAEAQGQGVMHEALTAIITWGFDHMQLNRIEAQIHPDNHASLKLALKLGFVQEGRLREVGYWGGQYHDMWQLALLRRDWAKAMSL